MIGALYVGTVKGATRNSGASRGCNSGRLFPPQDQRDEKKWCNQSSLRIRIAKECFPGGKEKCNYYQGQGADKGKARGRNVQLALSTLCPSLLGLQANSKQKPVCKGARIKQFSEISLLRPRWGRSGRHID